MSVTLRLARTGSKGKPQYRIVASQHGSRRDGKFIEILGTYNPQLNPIAINIKEEKIKKWLSVGAQPTSVVRDIIRKMIPGVMEQLDERRKAKVLKARKARKQRSKARSKK